MTKPKKYLLNGEPVDWLELIKHAEDWGMEHNGLLTTSMAAKFLRELGDTVEENPEVKDA
jgi:hypothetical protein